MVWLCWHSRISTLLDKYEKILNQPSGLVTLIFSKNVSYGLLMTRHVDASIHLACILGSHGHAQHLEIAAGVSFYWQSSRVVSCNVGVLAAFM